MESNPEEKDINEYAVYIYIRFFFTTIGVISYLLACVLFELFYKAPGLIKSEIFTYILFHTIKHIIEIILPQSSSPIFLYCFGIVEFYLILSHLNKCFSSKNIAENTTLYQLDYRYFILAIFIISTFPYEEYFKLADQFKFTLYTINIVLSILFFRCINIKMILILEYLKDKKVTNSSIPDLYLPYVKANYYYNNFNKINKMFYLTLGLVCVYYVINILNLFLDWKIIYKFLTFFSKECIYLSIVASCLMYFYCLNKDLLSDSKIPKEPKDETAALNKFRVIDVEIQHEEDDNIYDKKNGNNNKNKTNENEGEDEEKFKKEDKKKSEENE